MKKIFINRKRVTGPWGGENSFMGALCKVLQNKYEITTDINSKYNIALINALTLISSSDIEYIYSKGIPIIHRKTGFGFSGSSELRKKKGKYITGDKIQIQFSKYIKHSIFQSFYSKKVFVSQGFKGTNSVINNGADEEKFNLYEKWFFRTKKRNYWDRDKIFKILIVSWSSDPNKGFDEYKRIDKNITNNGCYQIKFVGNLPNDFFFKNIKYIKPLPHKRLANEYRSAHALLYLSKGETCSNTIIEAINCGLPVIFLDSGANSELVKNCGVKYSGNFIHDLELIKKNYRKLTINCENREMGINNVAPQYEKIIDKYII